MSDSIHQPQDKFFKRSLSKLQVAREFLQQHLPEDIKKLIDFNTLKFHKETFIDDSFKTSSADVIYSAQSSQGLAYFYILIEHQSTVDAWLLLRIIGYLCQLWKLHHDQSPDDPLPIVYPLIFYNGKTPYSATTRFFDLFGSQAELAQKIFTEDFRLIDVRKIEDEELRRYRWAGILEYVMKHRLVANVMEFAEEVMQWLQELERSDGFVYASDVIQYILSHSEGEQVEALVNAARTHLPESLEVNTMTFADQLRQQGYQRAMQEVKTMTFADQLREQGYQRAMQETKNEKLNIARELIAKGLSLAAVAKIVKLPKNEILETA